MPARKRPAEQAAAAAPTDPLCDCHEPPSLLSEHVDPATAPGTPEYAAAQGLSMEQVAADMRVLTEDRLTLEDAESGIRSALAAMVAPSLRWPVEHAAHGRVLAVCAKCKQPFAADDALGYYAGFPTDQTERARQTNGAEYLSLVALAHEGCL